MSAQSTGSLVHTGPTHRRNFIAARKDGFGAVHFDFHRWPRYLQVTGRILATKGNRHEPVRWNYRLGLGWEAKPPRR